MKKVYAVHNKNNSKWVSDVETSSNASMSVNKLQPSMTKRYNLEHMHSPQ